LQISLQNHWKGRYLSDWNSCLEWHHSIEFKGEICCCKLNHKVQLFEHDHVK
jgi:hypothetical protein